MKKIAIVSAKRTPIGRYKGKLRNYSAVELGTTALKGAIDSANIDPNIIQQVIFGNVLQSGVGQNPARQIAIKAGVPDTTPAMTINEVCGSGLKAIILGKQLIQLGEADVVAVGGVESMTNAPQLILKEGQEPVESFMHDGLTDAFHYVPMEQMTSDEGVRPNSSVEKLATLKTIFKEDGTVTGGNASSINDGSSALILMEESYAKAHGYDILGIVGDYAEVGCDPQYMGYAPFYAVEKLLDKTDSKIDDVDIVEMTEAFAAQSIPVKDNLHIPDEKLNIYGGAIALGHPIGASGARLVTTLVNALEQENKRTGIATACIGGGLGIALMIDKGE